MLKIYSLTRRLSLRFINILMHIITLLTTGASHTDCKVNLCVLVLCVYWQAEVNAQKASNNAQRSVRQLEETITDFQRQKLEDIQVSPKHTHTRSIHSRPPGGEASQ